MNKRKKRSLEIILSIFVHCCLFTVVCSLFSPTAFAAVGDQFTIGLTVTADVTPPTDPSGLSAMAVLSSQINLSWTASTDNVVVGGYVIRRGGVIIATSTGLGVTYSDTGLTPTTAYTYTVQAYDASLNYSAQSAPAGAITLGPSGGGGGQPPDTTPPTVSSLTPSNGSTGVSTSTTLLITMSESVNASAGNVRIKRQSDAATIQTIPTNGSQVTVAGALVTITLSSFLSPATQYYVEIAAGSFVDGAGNPFAGISGSATWSFTTTDTLPPIISGVSATTTYTTATIDFTTDESALATLEWGTSASYGDGTASEVGYGANHAMNITGLATNTLYYFRLTAKDASNNQSTPYTGNFSTQNPPPPPDTTPPANPSGFSGNPGLTNIQLSWTNPPDPDFAAVRIMRRQGGYPSDESDGVLVYDGSGESFNNTGLSSGTRYYYTAFARDTALNYSSGAIFTAITDSGLPPAPPSPSPAPSPSPSLTPLSPPPGEANPGGTGTSTTTIILPPITSNSTGPFVDFNGTGTPAASMRVLTLNDFTFTQLSLPGHGDIEVVLHIKNGVVRTDGTKSLRVSVSNAKFPETLLTIAISVEDPHGAITPSSYLLHLNNHKTAYEGVIPPLRTAQKFSFSINIIDHERQSLTRLAGIFDVYLLPQLPSFLPPAIAEAVTAALNVIDAPVQNVSPVAAPIGVAVGASQVILISTNVGSVYDLYLLILKLLALLTGLFRRRRNEPWGVVYDSVTKRPLDPAYVLAQIRNTVNTKGEAITDLDGRYGFFLNPGEYVIVANKTHYKFPSERLRGKVRDEFYENLYFGDPFQVREGGVVQYNIPLDPVEFDWNEFAKNQDQVFLLYSKKKNVRIWIFNIVFYVGMIFSILSLILSFTVINIVVVLIYLGIFIFQVLWQATHKITRVLSRITGKPIPFALIKVWLSGINTVVKKSVSDETGRFYFLVPPGKYYITIEEKQQDGSYKEVMRTEERELKGGVVKEDFLV